MRRLKNTGTSRNRRMNPTRTVYMIYYRATDGSGYQWTDEVYSRDQGLEFYSAKMPPRQAAAWLTGYPNGQYMPGGRDWKRIENKTTKENMNYGSSFEQ